MNEFRPRTRRAERSKQIFDHQLQIVRQRALVAKLERHDGSLAALHRAPTVLVELELNLADLKGNYARQKIANWGVLDLPSGLDGIVKSAVSAFRRASQGERNWDSVNSI